MNERIETLAKIAGYDMINKAGMKALGFDMEKFAELIVRECFEVVINDGRFNDCKGIIRGAEAVAKEHFGVE